MNTDPRRVYPIPLDLLDIDRRLRPVSGDYVELIAASMDEHGLRTPIEVGPASPEGRHRLIAGGHRVAAAKLLGWDKVDALIVEADELQAKLREIDENLMRRELSALDRAVFLAERKKVYEALNPTASHGKAAKGKGRKDATFSPIPSFRAEAAARLGLDDKTINRIVARAAVVEDLSEEMRQELALHPIAESGAELDALLRLTPVQRGLVIDELILDTPEKRARSVREALGRVTGAPATSRAAETARQLQALMGAWRKAGRAARNQFLDFLASEGEVPERQAKATGTGGRA